SVDQRLMGATIKCLAMRGGRADCAVNYTGDIWATLMKRKDPPNQETVLEETTRFMREEYATVCLGKLGFENAYTLAMRSRRAKELGISTIDDLCRHAPQLTIAGDLQFFERLDWFHVRDTYGLRFKEIRAMDPALMYAAVAEGKDVDVICAYSSDG